MEKNYYEQPILQIEEVAVENGIATTDSLLIYDETPSMPYGDDSEQWF